jgi:hypothetical protein
MRLKRAWPILLVVLIVLQALVRPEANVLSVRDDSFHILQRISAGRESPWPTQTGVPALMVPDYQCGFPVELEVAVPRLSEIESPLQWASERIYQGVLVDAAIKDLPPWQVRLWQFRYGLGLWSGRLDDGPVSPKKVEEARRFAIRYYQIRLDQVACDTARGLR